MEGAIQAVLEELGPAMEPVCRLAGRISNLCRCSRRADAAGVKSGHALLRVALVTIGSPDDFQPLLALGARLAEDGVTVKCFVDAGHCVKARALGLDCQSIGESWESFTKTEQATKSMQADSFMHLIQSEMAKFWDTWKMTLAGCLGEWRPSIVIYTSFANEVVMHHQMVHECPCIRVVMGPWALANNKFLPPGYNKACLDPDEPAIASWLRQTQFASFALLSSKLALEPSTGTFLPMLVSPELIFLRNFFSDEAPEPIFGAYSPSLVPVPFGYPKKNAQPIGRLRLTEEESLRVETGDSRPAAALEAFLESGAKPVCCSWGRIHVRTPQDLVRLAAGALMEAGKRGVVVVPGLPSNDVKDYLACLDGGGDSEAAAALRTYCESNVLFLDVASHEWLFPRCAVAVHHGPTSQTHVACEAGVPSIVTPVMQDELNMGSVVVEQKVGVVTSMLVNLASKELAAAITSCCEDALIQASVTSLGMKMKSEDGRGWVRAELGRFVVQDLMSGGFHKSLHMRKELCKGWRYKTMNASLTPDQMFQTPGWSTDLAERFPSIGSDYVRQFTTVGAMPEMIEQGKLWFVKDSWEGAPVEQPPAASAPEAQRRGALDECGAPGARPLWRFSAFTFLEELSIEGDKVHFKRILGSGPAEGWVVDAAAASTGKGQLVERIDTVEPIGPLIGAFWMRNYDRWRTGGERPENDRKTERPEDGRRDDWEGNDEAGEAEAAA